VSKRARNSRPPSSPGVDKRAKVRDIFVARPFAGLADECEWVALRELVPAATAPLTLAPPFAERYGERVITLATVLPMVWPAMVKPDGRVFLAMQRQTHSGDASRDLAAALLAALETSPGNDVSVPALPGEGPRLQDVLADGPLELTLHDGFEFWLEPDAADDPKVKASLERANLSIYPTERMHAVRAAYWCRLPSKAHVRWVLGDHEDRALDALARLGAAGGLLLGEGTKFAGMFRAHGLLIPVWDIPSGPAAADWEASLADLAKRYGEAIESEKGLDVAERRSRQGLLGRQLTLR
jgi:hypothetical protein